MVTDRPVLDWVLNLSSPAVAILVGLFLWDHIAYADNRLRDDI